jgi:hypothetical protein
MTLREARCTFSRALAELVLRAGDLGFEIAFDEVTDRVTEKDPTTDHMKGSLHEIGLAADLLLYKDGKYLVDTADYTSLGVLWEEMGKQRNLAFTWGGRFTKKDGNHFSLTWQGKS